MNANEQMMLREIKAACDDEISRGNSGFVRSFHLGGTPEQRSPRVKHRLRALGYIEGVKHNEYNKQGQWTWRITDTGRAALV